MDFVLLAARLLLAVVFLVAGLAKLADRAGTRQTLVGFGVPAPLAHPLGLLLPLLELAAAAALVPPVTAWWGALGALALLLTFVGGIGYNLARGRTPECHCFGQLHSAPAGRPTLARNAGLAALAGLVVWQGPAQPGAGVLGVSTAGEGAILAVGLLLLGLQLGEGWLLLGLLRQNGRLLLRIEALEGRRDSAELGAARPAQPPAGLPVGAPAPGFRLAALAGGTVTLDALRTAGRPVLLVFSDPGCGPCAALLPDVARWQREHAAALTVALVSRGDPGATRARYAQHGLAHVLFQEDREVAQAYQASATPAAVLVRADGTLGSRLAAGPQAIGDLVARSAGAATAPGVARLGDPAPPIRLPDLTGGMVDLADGRGRPTLVLFWNPGCGFCRGMLEDLKRWEADPPVGAPRLLVVSTGTVEANRALGLRSPVVLDPAFAAGRRFGATGTPTAVLLDAQGRVASEVVAGGAAVLTLAADPSRAPPRAA